MLLFFLLLLKMASDFWYKPAIGWVKLPNQFRNYANCRYQRTIFDTPPYERASSYSMLNMGIRRCNFINVKFTYSIISKVFKMYCIRLKLNKIKNLHQYRNKLYKLNIIKM